MARNSLSSWQQASMRGIDMAAREHSFLHLDLTERIDIFSILQRRGIWTMFQPLDELYGACLHDTTGTVGVLLNVHHPLSLQRFTAAHEYGHVLLQHKGDISCDGVESILSSRQTSLQELEAQTFAAHFLMPIQLVNRTLRQMGFSINPGTLNAQEVYQLSLRLGASYAAVVNHLTSLHKINQSLSSTLLHEQPKQIKAQLRNGLKPTNRWSEAWKIDERDHDKHIYLLPNDEVHLYLPEQGVLSEPITTEGLKLTVVNVSLEIVDRMTAHQSEQTVYLRHYVFQAEMPEEGQIIINGNKKDFSSYRVHVHIAARHETGLIRSQQQYL